MKTSAAPLLPPLRARLARAGEQLRLARLRRRLSASLVCERAGLSRPTLNAIEKGDPGVGIGTYARVLNALGLADDVLKLAADDELGRKLQDIDLPPRPRGSRRAR
ncbi:MAG: helix-turn-helix domain-containing protein [Betaproteobacteria bacterium]